MLYQLEADYVVCVKDAKGVVNHFRVRANSESHAERIVREQFKLRSEIVWAVRA